MAPAEPEPTRYDPPQFTQPLVSQSDVPENSVVVFECFVVPTNDPDLKLAFYLNDTPLKQSNRHMISSDFGHVMLRINGVSPHDTGTYTVKAVNLAGAANTSASLSVVGGDTIISDSAHPQAYQKIQQLEGIDRFPRLEFPDEEFTKPIWVRTFEDVNVEEEGQVGWLIDGPNEDVHHSWADQFLFDLKSSF